MAGKFIKNAATYIEKRFFSKKSVSEIITRSIAFILFALLAASYLYVLFWMLMSSLKTHTEVVLDPFGLPETIQWHNYNDIFSKMKVGNTTFFGMVLNSLYFSVCGGLLSMTFTSMLAYATTKYKFPGAGIYPAAVLFSITLPIYGTGGSAYKLYFDLNLLNSPLFILTSTGGMTIYYLYFRAFYQNLSWSYAEAAMIDGANDFTIYFRVMLPQSMALFWSLFVLVWVAQWNDVNTSLLYLRKMPQLSVGLYLFEKDMIYDASKHLLYAGCTIACIPPLLLFVFCNRIMTSNISVGGLKG